MASGRPTNGHSTREELIYLLRRAQRSSAAEIGVQLGITANAVRQHIERLERDGLVASGREHHARGRPTLKFYLTELADEHFPKRYAEMVTALLTELEEMGGPLLINELYRKLADRQVRLLRDEVSNMSTGERLDHVVKWMHHKGVLIEAERNQISATVRILDCPFRQTAMRFPQVCSTIPTVIGEVVGRPLRQERYIGWSDPYCSFLVTLADPSIQAAD